MAYGVELAESVVRELDKLDPQQRNRILKFLHERVARLVLVQSEMEKNIFPLVKIPPLRGGDFQGMRIHRPMPVSRSFAIGTMSPTRLSLSMVASLQSPLPFHLARSL